MKKKIDAVKSFYDKESTKYLAERYEGETCEHYAYQSRQDIVLDMLADRSGSIIDIGCGPGVYAETLLQRGFRPVFVDLSFDMLTKGFSLKTGGNGSYAKINAEIERLCFKDGSFDNALCIGVIAYAESAEFALREACRVLRPGGCLIVQSSNSACPTTAVTRAKDAMLYALRIREKGYSFKLAKYRFGSFKKILDACGFRVVAKRSYDFRLPFLEKVSRTAATGTMRALHPALSASQGLGWLGEGFIVKAMKR